MKILTKTHVIYLKRKLRTCRIQIQVEKVWFVTKKLEKNNFQNFFFKGGTLWCQSGRKTFFRFFKFSKFFFEKWPQWDIINVERNKVMKYELNRSVHWGISRVIPPCKIGLNNFIMNNRGSFNNLVDKKGFVGGQPMSTWGR